MKNLKSLSKEELAAEYYNQQGVSGDYQPVFALIAALYYGKRIKYLTAEELANIEEL